MGPALKDLGQRRERDWLVRWMQDPIQMALTDPVGQELYAAYNNIPMAPPGLNDLQISNVLDYIDAASAGLAATMASDAGPVDLNESQFARAGQIFFDRCAGCHGTLRAGATGPNIQPERTTQIGTTAL